MSQPPLFDAPRGAEPGEINGSTPSSSIHQPLSVAFVATCPPRQCGIATFTNHLAHAIKAADPSVRISWAAINDAESIHPYGPAVRWRIRQRHPETYRQAALEINNSTVNVVNVQHEFGLYGVWGEPFKDHLQPFLEALRKPLVTTMHTVLPDPSGSVRKAVQRIGERSQLVIAMAELARRLLIDKYGLEAKKVLVVHHGVPAIQPRGRTKMKEQLGLQGRLIVSTFGLVDNRKGLEYMIRAMEAIIQRYPEALYLIVGKTHPERVRELGESYRKQLLDLVESRGLGQHVAFVDEYLTQRQVVDYLLATDVYVTPYLDPNQITSGTLAYALGAGKAIVSTPYLHATEALSKRRGVLVDFRSEEPLAEAVLQILDDPRLKQRLESRAYEYGHKMAWPEIGKRMIEVYRSITGVPAALHPEQLPLPALPEAPVALRRVDRLPLLHLANLSGQDQTEHLAIYAEQGFAVEPLSRVAAALNAADSILARQAAEDVAEYVLDGPYDGALIRGGGAEASALQEALSAAGIRCFTNIVDSTRVDLAPEQVQVIVEIGTTEISASERWLAEDDSGTTFEQAAVQEADSLLRASRQAGQQPRSPDGER
jgi:glycosyltransferase involved in cell wall biosynthesis